MADDESIATDTVPSQSSVSTKLEDTVSGGYDSQESKNSLASEKSEDQEEKTKQPPKRRVKGCCFILESCLIFRPRQLIYY